MLIHLLLPFRYMISSNAYLFICETYLFICDMISSNTYLFICETFIYDKLQICAYPFASTISIYDKLKCLSNYL